MPLIVLGVSHHTASIDQRARLALSPVETQELLADLRGSPSIQESLVLSTCNRSEIYAVVNQPAAGFLALSDAWARRKALRGNTLEPTFRLVGPEAVLHAHRVVAGLDSRIRGEGQIVAQVKNAMDVARTAKSSGKLIEALFQGALCASKRIRTSTGLEQSRYSAASAAADAAHRFWGDLTGRTILILGAGEMGERALLAFLSRGDCRVLLANRTNSRALALGKVPAVTAIPWEAWEAHMSTADVIVGCTGAQSPLVVPKQFSSDRSGPQLFIDLGLPRNFDSNIEQVPGIHLVDLDGLEGLAGNSESNPALIEAERLAEEMASRCQERLLSFNADPVIRQLIAFAETEREQMLHNFLKRRKGLLERDAEAALRLFSSQLQKKLLHEPISRIKSASPSERVLLLGILTKTPSAAETAPPHEKPFRPFSRAPKQRSLIPWPEHKLSR